MPSPVLIIVTGLPGSGKTTLGRRLAQDLGLPFINKDGIKEQLFDSLGWSDRAWSQKLGRATYDLLYYFTETLLSAGCSFVLESNFDPQHATPQFRQLRGKYKFEPLQLFLEADGQVLYERFKARWQSGGRHPGHVEHLQPDQASQLLTGTLEPLDIGGRTIRIDTTDWAAVDYPALVNTIRSTWPSFPIPPALRAPDR